LAASALGKHAIVDSSKNRKPLNIAAPSHGGLGTQVRPKGSGLVHENRSSCPVALPHWLMGGGGTTSGRLKRDASSWAKPRW
jgi:hypothetical protein